MALELVAADFWVVEAQGRVAVAEATEAPAMGLEALAAAPVEFSRPVAAAQNRTHSGTD